MDATVGAQCDIYMRRQEAVSPQREFLAQRGVRKNRETEKQTETKQHRGTNCTCLCYLKRNEGPAKPAAPSREIRYAHTRV